MENKLITKTDRAMNTIAAIMMAGGSFIAVLLLSVPYTLYRACKKSRKAYRKAQKYPVKHVL